MFMEFGFGCFTGVLDQWRKRVKEKLDWGWLVLK
jgi:hypothetical protein